MGKVVSSREAITALEDDGWREVNHVGSHKQFKHPIKKGRVTVQTPVRELSLRDIKSIEAQSGVKLR